MAWVNKEDLNEGDLLIAPCNKKDADQWDIDYPDGHCGPSGYWLQIFHLSKQADSLGSCEPIAQFASEESATNFALQSADPIVVWLVEE